jgi:N-acetylglucosaminyl-diphospho-decaprenol L-rhamnosyltransferase
MRTLGVVVVSWNVRALVGRCLASLRAAVPDGRIVVVDNASDDGTVDEVRRQFPEVRLIVNGANVGFARANNQGLRALGIGVDRAEPAPPSGAVGPAPPSGAVGPAPATHAAEPPKLVLMLNPDTEIVGDALGILQGALDRDPAAACVGPRLVYPDGRYQSSCRRFPTVLTALLESTPAAWHWPGNPVARGYRLADAEPVGPGSVEWLTGACLLMRSEALAAVGLFDEGFFMYSEELDLCRRLGQAGWRILYEPRATVIHVEAASSDQAIGARHRRFQRARVQYFAKHHGRLAALIVDLGVRLEFGVEMGLEAVKSLLGHRRPMRRARIGAYWKVVRPDRGAT